VIRRELISSFELDLAYRKDRTAMQRDPILDRRILLAIEAKRSRAPGPIDVDGTDPQVVLDHLASMFEEGLYSGPKPHKSGSTGLIDVAHVRDLTTAGRQRLKELEDERQRRVNETMQGLAVTLGPEPPELELARYIPVTSAASPCCWPRTPDAARTENHLARCASPACVAL
jgi:hypothetical protein